MAQRRRPSTVNARGQLATTRDTARQFLRISQLRCRVFTVTTPRPPRKNHSWLSRGEWSTVAACTFLKLTTADAAQMAGLDRQVCRILLRTLIDTGFLEQRVRGTFVRRSPDFHSP